RRPTACEDGGRLGESQHSQAPDAPAGASPTNQLISSSLPAPVSRFRLPIHLRRSGNRKQPAISFLQIHQLSLKQVHQLSWPLILAVTGMRISEALALRLEDVTADGLIVRQTKFQKSRLLPLHNTTQRALDKYLSVRLRLGTLDRALLVSTSGKGVAYDTARLSEDSPGRSA